MDARLGGAQQALDLAQLRVSLLQFGGFAGEHVDPTSPAPAPRKGPPRLPSTRVTAALAAGMLAPSVPSARRAAPG
ncbi:MAG: hypothetical protein ACRDK7_15905 [Solirubrobacteraceae bacterium]